MTLNLINLLRSLLGLGKKNNSDGLVQELQGINGVGPEYAKRLAKIYKTRDAIKRAGDGINLMLPDHIAKKVMDHLRK